MKAQEFRFPLIVVIEETNELATRMPKARVARAGLTAILLLDINNPIAIRFQNNFQRGCVGRSIVYEENLEILEGLPEHGINSVSNVSCRHVGRDDHAHQRRGLDRN